jgi:hypothetical protein
MGQVFAIGLVFFKH